jgi:osmotically-inducible protein OsmY
MATTDENIQQDVMQELRWNSRLQPNEIGVAVKDGIVTLMGAVDSYAKKLAAEEAAFRVHGVKAVANDIQVHLPGVSENTDTDLAQRAREVLLWDGEVPANNVSIMVSNGWITLEGEVEHAYQKEAAERVISHLVGITGVSNRIMVQPQGPPEPLKEDIQRALVRNAQTDARHIQVEVMGRQVLLRGMVSSYAEKQAAEQAAWAQTGVADVENTLIIGA